MLMILAYSVAVIVGITLRVRFLPAAALVLLAVFPAAYLSVGWPQLIASPAVLVLIVWLLRTFFLSRKLRIFTTWGAAEYSLLAFVAIIAVSSAASESLTLNSWLGVALVCTAVIPLSAGSSARSGVSYIGPTWGVLTAVVGSYALVERALQQNPLYGRVFAMSPQSLDQKWSVYRSTSTIGHPLLLSAFLAAGVAICIGLWIQRSDWRWSIPMALGIAGVIASGSRSGLVSIAAAAVAAVFVGLVRRSKSTARSVVILAPLGIMASAIALTMLSDRLTSSEAALSASYRDTLASIGLYFASVDPMFGLGISGLADSASRAGLSSGGNYENSWIELCLAFGYPAAIASGVVVTLFALRASVSRNLAGVALMVSLVLSSISFNMVFGHPVSLLLFGMAFLYCSSGRDAVADSRTSLLNSNRGATRKSHPMAWRQS